MIVKKKSTDRVLMRQKINISPVLLNKWKDNYLFDIRQMVHGSLLEKTDLYTTFEHQERTFEIVGMGEGRSLMLRETRSEGVFYWECTRQFVQMKLERYNQEFLKVEGSGKTRLSPIPYTESELLLAPLKARRGRRPAETEDENIEDETLYVETYDDLDTETEEINTDEIF